MTKSNDDEDTSLTTRLRNYKMQHASTANEKGVSVAFAAARTLTEAKKVLWGEKSKNKPLKKSRLGDIIQSPNGTNGGHSG